MISRYLTTKLHILDPKLFTLKQYHIKYQQELNVLTCQMALYVGTLRVVGGTEVCDHIQRQAPPYLKQKES